VIRHEDFTAGAFDAFDLAVVGPGPGDPRDASNPKIATFRGAVDGLLESGKPFLAVCLGHQVLCDRIGIPLAYKDIVFQGTQSTVSIGGHQEPVGFYNTFVGRLSVGRGGEPEGLPDRVTVEADPATGDLHLLAGPHYRGVQFHAESILTENGVVILRDLLLELIGPGA
jgi:phenazine biosynthesis protein phzE